MDHCRNSVNEDICLVDCLVFDLNDTLYTSEPEIKDGFHRNMEDYIVNKCGVTEDKASTLRKELRITYGSTYAGLKKLGYDVDSDEFHDFIHEMLPYDKIKPDMQLRKLLLSIQKRKVVFTHSREHHTHKILEGMGIHDCFDQIVGFETLNAKHFLIPKADRPDKVPFVIKSSIKGMKIGLDAIKVDPHHILFLDNKEENIAAGKAVGLQTVLVGKKTRSDGADYVVENLADLREVVPQIWVGAADILDRKSYRFE